MGQITKTLGEILEIPNYELFFPHDIYNYERFIGLFINCYYNREIAYDTVDYFRMRLNYFLELHRPVYNKMLASEAVEFDPFMTDYIETNQLSQSDTTEGLAEGVSSGTVTADQRFKDIRDKERQRYTGKDYSENHAENVSVDVNAVLFSQAENTSEDSEKTERKDYRDDTNQNITKTVDTQYGEIVDTTTDDDTKYHETDVRDINRDTDRTQTGRQWSEKGNSKTHNLDVNSDAPQSMLFNIPNHYYGTGTADDFGEVVTDSSGNQTYKHYGEGDIDFMDSQPRQIDGGNTPWYNYATTAGNRIGHDSYSRSGNETYNIKENQATSDDLTKDSSTERDIHKLEHTEGWKHEDTNQNLAEIKQGNHDIVDKASMLNSKAVNSNEHAKNDSKDESQSSTDRKNAYAKYTGLLSHTKENGSETSNTQTSRNLSRGISNDTYMKSVRSGRLGKSPSQLMKEYRDIITYSADRWLLGELERVFLSIY